MTNDTTERLPYWLPGYLRPDSTLDYAELQKPLRLGENAQVRQRVKLNPGSLKEPPSQGAKYVSHGINGAWEFSSGADDTIGAVFEQPTNIENAIEVRIMWSSSETTGDCLWQLEYLYVSEGEDSTASAEDTLQKTQTTSGTANVIQQTNFSGVNNPSDNDIYMSFRLRRLGTDGSDTISGSVELIGITYEYVSDRLGADYSG